MKRDDVARLRDIIDACDAIAAHTARGDLSDGLIFDAVRVRLIEIGEATKGISPETLAREPGVSWREVAGMRDLLAHHYFDTSHSVVAATIEKDMPTIREAATRLLLEPA